MPDGVMSWNREPAACDKWRASFPASAHWFSQEDLERLICAKIAKGDDYGRQQTVREFVAEFRGFAGSAAQRNAIASYGFGCERLSDLQNGNGLEPAKSFTMLRSLRDNSRIVKAMYLGCVGEDHLRVHFDNICCQMNTFRYKRVLHEGPVPYILEAAFGLLMVDDVKRRFVAGVNWSPAIGNPFERTSCWSDSITSVMTQQRCKHDEPIVIFLHLAHPNVDYTDRGKSKITEGTVSTAAVRDILVSVTSAWKKQRDEEDRDCKKRRKRAERMAIDFKEKDADEKATLRAASFEIMKTAYLKASDNGKLPVKPRQIMYAARPYILDRTGRLSLNKSAYFAQVLLLKFMENNPTLTSTWDIVWDDRGTMMEPHTNKAVPLGTLAVRRYLLETLLGSSWSEPEVTLPEFLTVGPLNRYSDILAIEKEGFNELFRAVRLAEEFDIAICSLKGLSPTAARDLASELCFKHGMRLFVLHDFDKAGFSIIETLRSSNDRYTFKYEFEVIDLGLRLTDVIENDLQSEDVVYGEARVRKDHSFDGKRLAETMRANLRKNGATDDEIDFLISNAGGYGRCPNGQQVRAKRIHIARPGAVDTRQADRTRREESYPG